MVEGLKDKGLGELVMILFETSLIKVAIQVISIVIMLVVYGRLFEIYVYSSVSAIPFATMGKQKSGDRLERTISKAYLPWDYKDSFNGLSWNIRSIS